MKFGDINLDGFLNPGKDECLCIDPRSPEIKSHYDFEGCKRQMLMICEFCKLEILSRRVSV